MVKICDSIAELGSAIAGATVATVEILGAKPFPEPEEGKALGSGAAGEAAGLGLTGFGFASANMLWDVSFMVLTIKFRIRVNPLFRSCLNLSK